MSLETDVRTYLLTKAGVTTYVGSGSSARVYAMRAPQPSPTLRDASFPRITYTLISNNHIRGMAGSLGHADARMQISCFALRYLDDGTTKGAKSLSNAVRIVMDGANTTMGSTRVRRCFLETEVDFYEPPEHADDVGVYHVAMDFQLAYQETVPTL